MYYRRKILLSLLRFFNNNLGKIELQKLLLEFTLRQSKPAFYFIPYRFGCFSSQANADLKTLQKYGYVTNEDKRWTLIKDFDINENLTADDKIILEYIKLFFKEKSEAELLKYSYTKHPYYAINSEILDKVLDGVNIKRVLNSRPQNNKHGLYTIGYEGISLEQYLNKLIKYDIKILCDVRRNPLSMKYGFSKNQLKNACEHIKIQYIHFPELGISSDERRDLNTQQDYDKLFINYTKALLNTTSSQTQLINLINTNKRVAITCFEADICRCHRLHLANSININPLFKYKVFHI